MDDLISVIVPVYNIEDYLPRCLDSVYNQTYKNLEIILVDDGSTDRSGKICDDYSLKDNRSRVIHQDNRGQWFARNAGQNAAEGSFLYFPDGDDYFHYDMIRQMHQAITSGKGYDVAIVGCLATSRPDENVVAPIEGEWTEYSQECILKALLSSNDYPQPQMWNKLFRKTSLGDIQNRPFPRAQDFDFVLRFILKNGKAIGTRAAMYYWMKHEGQVSQVHNADLLYCKNDTEICRSILESLPGSNEYRGLLLDFMYRQMAKWRQITLDTADYESTRKECERILSATIKEYKKNPETPTIVKLVKILCIRHPKMWAFFLRFLNGKREEPCFIKMLKKRGLVKTIPFP
jgi:glycosyltransferase involved in cell wall biosynthesis